MLISSDNSCHCGLIRGKISGCGRSSGRKRNDPSHEVMFPVGNEKLLCMITALMIWQLKHVFLTSDCGQCFELLIHKIKNYEWDPSSSSPRPYINIMSKHYSNMDTQLCASIVNGIHKQPDIRICVYAINAVIFQNYPLQWCHVQAKV